jgi:copper chaperone NosL
MRMAIKMGAVAVLVLLLSLAQPGTGSASGKSPAAALQPMAEDGRLQMSSSDRCPVCGMFPFKRPHSAAGMMLSDGRAFYFCGNGCLLRTWRHAPVYLGVSQDRIQRMVVQDYFSGAPLDARAAFWVAGSDVIGPMGPALVALKTSRDVEQFRARHGGRAAFKLDLMEEALWNSLFPPK